MTQEPIVNRRVVLAALLVLSALLNACAGDSGSGTLVDQDAAAAQADGALAPGPDASIEGAVTYHEDLAPILDAACTSCHTEGASAPFSLTTYEATKVWGAASLAAMKSGRMPPWLPDPSCREFVGQRSLPEGAIETLESWLESDMAEGTPASETEAPPLDNLVVSDYAPTHSSPVTPPYAPNPEVPDDYRCFVLDFIFETEQFMLASKVLPDQKHLVHHVLVYAIGGDALVGVLEADGQSEDGFTCFGTPFPSNGAGPSLDQAGALPILVGAWVPGTTAPTVNLEISTRIPAGSRIVMQIHYNTLAGELVADESTFEMMLQSDPTPYLAAARPLLLPELFAAAGDPEAVNSHLFKNYTDEPITIVRLGPHMHLLGSRIKSEVVRANGDVECAVDIPVWDFNWQEGYILPEEEPIVLAPGDGLSLECVYDNSAENQPSVNGVIQDPKHVSWGEGTTDEMCMNYITMVEPYTPSKGQGAACYGAGACLAQCPDDATAMECLLACDIGLECVQCALTQSVACIPECLPALGGLFNNEIFSNCFVNRMALGSTLDACLAAELPEAYFAYTSCTEPHLQAGSCDTEWTGCGMDLEAVEADAQ
jgi:hypothetical protein